MKHSGDTPQENYYYKMQIKCALDLFFFPCNIKDGQADANNGLDIVAAASWWFTSAGIVIRTLLVFTNFRNFQRCIKQ